ncbi:inositol 2-dehydrogenase [Nitrospira sp. KM1]|uniref:Gfo/Idh/MocA family protein n=1 Tax=Nitrospira sp. KM1 TaxID=1936990 RepID=UPI0013A78CB1|nr:Gfo/Idh/MocA family oxidoreductase [Nitrospira sp. KM1]BCA55527.1 inositol 2-dehydrogenase [Nitrospira sp. KM1]
MEGDTEIRIGFVGCGRVTEQLHLPALKSLQGMKIVGLADMDPEALHRASRHVDAEYRFTDYQDLLKVDSIDAVAICVPAQKHVEVALAALDAGKHLFIEKPLALTLEDCDRLIDRASRTTRMVMLGFNVRWHRLARQARALIQEGRLGPLDLIRSVLTSSHDSVPEWRKTRATGGGAMLEMAIHHFDLWRYLAQAEVEEVSAYTRSGLWEDESATVIARMSNGVLATVACAERTSQNNSVEICGRTGSLALSFYRFDGLECATTTSIPGDVRSRVDAAKRLIQELPQALLGFRHGGEWLLSYRDEWRHFLASLQNGAQPGCTLEDGRQALAVALAAINSASTGKSVRVDRR